MEIILPSLCCVRDTTICDRGSTSHPSLCLQLLGLGLPTRNKCDLGGLWWLSFSFFIVHSILSQWSGLRQMKEICNGEG